MKRKWAVTAVWAVSSALLPLSSPLAGEIPPADGKPLSAILKSVEAQKIGRITQAEFDDGLWELKICGANDCQKLYLDPRTGDEKRRRRTDRDEPPSANAAPLSTTIESIETRGIGAVTEVEFDDGVWTVKLRQGSNKTKLIADPITGKTKR
jgi:hypothetical protein